MGEQRVRVESTLRAHRLAKGLTQLHLCGLARVSPLVVRRAERGDILKLQVGGLLRVASVLDCTVADLFPLLGASRQRGKRSAGSASMSVDR